MRCAPDKFTVVGTFGSVAEARRRGQRAAGLEVRLDNAQTLGVPPMHSLAIGAWPCRRATPQARAILASGSTADPRRRRADSAIALHAPDAWMRRAAVMAVIGSSFVLPTLCSLDLPRRYGAAS
jgi:hypothetical protein